MKLYQDKVIVAVDTGYGNIKTANHCFQTGITAYDSEPLFTKDMLIYGGKYYLIGEGHKEFLPEKQLDEDYFLLTLVAIAKELKTAGMTEADVILAVGLPLTWMTGQKEAFRSYLLRDGDIHFTYRKVSKMEKTMYHLCWSLSFPVLAETLPMCSAPCSSCRITA